VGRVHRQALEVLGQASFPGGRRAFDHEAADLEILRELAFVGEAPKRTTTPLAGLDRKAATRFLHGGHDKILEKATRLHVGLELEVGLFVGPPPRIARGLDELVQRNGPDHGTAFRMRAGAAFTHPSLTLAPAPSPPLPPMPPLAWRLAITMQACLQRFAPEP